MEKIIVLGALFFVLIMHPGCTSFSEPEEKKSSFLDYPPELEQVHELILKNKTQDALVKIDDYLNRAENIHWYGHAYFLKGFVYELDEKFDPSIKFYRSAIQHGSSYDSKVQAKALYNLSFVYERIENLPEMLTTLLDLMKRRQFFDVLTGQVEIPARLAAAYASQGKLKEGMIFHREAANNFKILVRNERFRSPKEEVSKSLYYLGFTNFDQSNEKFDDLIKKLDAGQKYFLASAEASKSTWSEKSRKRLSNQYNRAWGMINEFEPKGFKNDSLAKKKRKHMRQLEMASDLYDLMHRIRAEEFPLTYVNNESKEIMEKTSQWIDKIEKFALTLKLGPETIRSKAIKNKRLSRYIEEKEKPVKVNKEKQAPQPDGSNSKPESPKKVDKPKDIGEDPNL